MFLFYDLYVVISSNIALHIKLMKGSVTQCLLAEVKPSALCRYTCVRYVWRIESGVRSIANMEKPNGDRPTHLSAVLGGPRVMRSISTKPE